MPSTRPFFDPENGSLDADQLLREAIPVAKLIAVFVAIALVPLLFLVLVGGTGGPGIVFVLLTQFVLAVGAAVTLIYVIARGIALADGATDDADGDDADSDDAATSRR